MTVIDIDTHFEPGRQWLADYPKLVERLPEYSVAEATMRAQVGDLLAQVPPEDRPPIDALLPPGLAAILGQVKVDGYGFEGSAMHTQTDAATRIAWMDRVGIDAANTICLQGAGYSRYLDDRALAREAISACNTWLAEQVAGHEDRLLPLTAIAYALAADPSGAVGGAAWAWPAAGFIADVAMLGLGIYWAVEYRLE